MKVYHDADADLTSLAGKDRIMEILSRYRSH